MKKRVLSLILAVVMVLTMMPAALAAGAREAITTKITMSRPTLPMYVGNAPYQLKATVAPANASKSLTWSTTNAKVATVSKTGKVTAQGLGTCYIRAAATDGSKKVAQCKVTVIPKVTMSRATLPMFVGNDPYQLKATVAPANAGKNLTWSTTDPEVATVSKDGKVTAQGMGACVIRATVADATAYAKYQVAECRVTVIPNVAMSRATLPMFIDNEPYQLEAAVSPDNAGKELIWATTDETVATVDETGKVTAQGLGECVIRATIADAEKYEKFQFAECKVYIIPKVTLDRDNLAMRAGGEPQKLAAAVTPAEYAGAITWTSSDETVATVDSEGTVTAVGKGTCVIQAAAGNADDRYARFQMAQCEVTVTDPVQTVALQIEEEDVLIFTEGVDGQSKRIEAEVLPADALNQRLTWSLGGSQAEKFVLRDEAGEIVPLDTAVDAKIVYLSPKADVVLAAQDMVRVIATSVDNDAASANVLGLTLPTAKVTMSKAVWTAETPNAKNVNAMMDALWNGLDSEETFGFKVGKVFSFQDGLLTIDGDNVTDELLAWINTQWGGSSVPVAVAFANGTPAGAEADPNWNDSYVAWIDLSDLKVTEPVVTAVRLTSGALTQYAQQVVFATPEITIAQPVWSAQAPNAEDVNAMMDALWNGLDSEEAFGFKVGQVFSFADGKLTINGDNVTDELLAWINTQWGGSSVPVAVDGKGNFSPAALNRDANWNNAYLTWIDLADLQVRAERKVEIANETGTVSSYKDEIAFATPEITIAQPVWSAQTPNAKDVNAMMDALWNGLDSEEAFGFKVGQVFSFAGGKLTIDGDNVTDELLAWINTQWGGSSVPVALTGTATFAPAELQRDDNWSGAYLTWIDLADLQVRAERKVEIANETGTVSSYKDEIVFKPVTVTAGQAAWTAATPNAKDVNAMMDALWNGLDSEEAFGFKVGQVFSFAGGKLTVNGDNVTDELLAWINTQWGGSSVPVSLVFSSSTPEELAQDANWDNAYLEWIDLGGIDAPHGDNLQYGMENGLQPILKVSYTLTW